MSVSLSARRTIKAAIGIIGFFVISGAMIVGVFLTQQETQFWGKAYKKDILVQTFCSAENNVQLEISYTNTQQGKADPLKVSVEFTDNQSGEVGTISDIAVGETKSTTINTKRTSLDGSGLVARVSRVGGGGKIEEEGVSYNPISCIFETESDIDEQSDQLDFETQESPVLVAEVIQSEQDRGLESETQSSDDFQTLDQPKPSTTAQINEDDFATQQNTQQSQNPIQEQVVDNQSSDTQQEDDNVNPDSGGFGGLVDQGESNLENPPAQNNSVSDPNSNNVTPSTPNPSVKPSIVPTPQVLPDKSTNENDLALNPNPTTTIALAKPTSFSDALRSPFKNGQAFMSNLFGNKDENEVGNKSSQTGISFDDRAKASDIQLSGTAKAQQSRPIASQIVSVDSDKVFELSTEGWQERLKILLWVAGFVGVFGAFKIIPKAIVFAYEKVKYSKEPTNLGSLIEVDMNSGQPLPTSINPIPSDTFSSDQLAPQTEIIAQQASVPESNLIEINQSESPQVSPHSQPLPESKLVK